MAARSEGNSVVTICRCSSAGTSTSQPTAKGPAELLAADAVDDKVGRRAENLEDVAEFHEEESRRRTALRIVLPNDLQQARQPLNYI